MMFGVSKREKPTIKTFQNYTNKEMKGYEIIYKALIWSIREEDPQGANFLELLFNIARLAIEDEALREPMAEEIMNSPMFKAWCRSALKGVMEDPTIVVPENVKDFLKV